MTLTLALSRHRRASPEGEETAINLAPREKSEEGVLRAGNFNGLLASLQPIQPILSREGQVAGEPRPDVSGRSSDSQAMGY
jgi:hypothetical protein